jgi:ABC-type transport system substrate-binding protein
LYKYDPVKAKALLAQAGFPNGITVDVGMIQNTYYVALSEAIQAMVKASGFTFNLKSVTGAEINNRLYTLKNLPVAITAYRGSPDPGLTLEAKFSAKGSANAAGTAVPGVDTLLIKSAGATDATLRAKWLKEAELIVMQGAYSIPIYHNAGLVAFTPKFVGTIRGYTTCQFGDFVSAEVYFKK